ncbi:UDP-glucose:glycoprotein glucosyltransferase [Klebsormidium nitens]|uniref:UDP-glucose:glycoprotein glucosyltransferase n=1 Tax=Klebsormidium nitens TaxID=105231 RepID=A0A0U9HMB3_KLENI|nr:UDP-glucose:glycoprotein glucosyltransferase [Klebsormidium nitens]|eukprot:GAQ80221.1 UDP-glucose:glycoprotein glucosyltransferase [Klebsormidium nitens]
MARQLCIQFLLAAFLLLGLRHVHAAPASKVPKGVNVVLRSKWEGTPLLLEAGELLAEHDSPSFWHFLDAWTAQTPTPNLESNDSWCAEQILSQATQNFTQPQASLFHLSLSLRLASPKLVVYRQLASESLERLGLASLATTAKSKDDERWKVTRNPASPGGAMCCWVEAPGKSVLRTARELEEELAEESGATAEEVPRYAFDHVHPASKRGARLFVLYGALGTPCFAEMHRVLSEAVQSGKGVAYIYRPVLPSGCESAASPCARIGTQKPVDLAGFGAELALKNMEYKAADDSEVKKDGSVTSDGPAAEDLTQEVNGFIFSKLVERRPDKEAELLTFRDVLLSSGAADDSDKISVWELKEIGLQAVQRIVQAREPLRLMQDINQNFPNVASSLSRTPLNASVRAEIEANQKMVAPGRTLLAINRALVPDVDSLDLFSLIDRVSADVTLGAALARLGLPADVSGELLALPEPPDDVGGVRVDFQGDGVHWLNDIESDSQYRMWRSSLQELLMPTYPGQLRQIRRNLFSAVFVLDPASTAALKIFPTVMLFYQRSIPVRFGVMLVSPTHLAGIEREEEGQAVAAPAKLAEDLSELVTQVFLYLEEELGREHGFRFLAELARAWGGDADEFDDFTDDVSNDSPLTLAHVEAAYAALVRQTRGSVKRKNLGDFLAGIHGETYREGSLAGTEFAHKKGLAAAAPVMLMNGKVHPAGDVQATLVQAIQEETQYIQQEYYYGRLKERMNILEYVLHSGSQPRYSPLILKRNAQPSDASERYVSLAGSVADQTRFISYLHHPGTADDVKPVTHWVVANLGGKRGLGVLKQAVGHVAGADSAQARLAVLLNGEGEPGALERVVLAALQVPSRRQKIVPFLQRLLSSGALVESLRSATGPVSTETTDFVLRLAAEAGLREADLRSSLTEPASLSQMLEDHRRFCEDVLGLPRGTSAVVTNGRVTALPDSAPALHADDFSLLESLELRARAEKVLLIIEDAEFSDVEPDDLTSDFLSDVILGVTSALAARKRAAGGTANFGLLKTRHSAIVLEGDPSSSISIEAVVDPLSPSAQKLTSLLVLLHEWLNPSIRIILNPVSGLSDIPLKNFYRYAAPSRLDAPSPAPPAVSFSHLPPSRTLTFNLDVPEPWLVEAVQAPYDLDNLRLEQLGESRSMHAVYELEALMLTGHCFDSKTREPPRGLQLALGSGQKLGEGEKSPFMVDTIVMANLGYFQLKAAPGVWNLSLVPGRSTELYALGGGRAGGIRRGGEHGGGGERFQGKVVAHGGDKARREREGEAVGGGRGGWQGGGFETGGCVGSRGGVQVGDGAGAGQEVAAIEGRGACIKKGRPCAVKRDSSSGEELASTVVAPAASNETIHVFAVASGHLYERLMKIMVLSVIKQTQRPVKFWFIKNYLSPRFKDFIPHMAREYGFEYALVTYKWPSWLHKQTEKQRIIWAYKILFLDVLFPLDLKKVIFVDADQVVRTDMAELYDMDLKGAPLAYTPFCDNNKDMDGFRFWKQGFWKDHLQGKPYHISALYVVDLARFRRMAAGDHLRVFYESLSKDPNSLANLDQDLPNYAQHMVPIYSLPREWLWCESWCGNATKAQAKTIDLCNNPMTKEPKLEAARRIVAEWPALDEEQRRLTDRVEAGEFDDVAGSEDPPTTARDKKLDSGSVEEIQSDNLEEKGNQRQEDTETAAEL